MRQLSDIDFGNLARILNLPDGVDPQHPVTVAQLRAAIEGISWKTAVRVSTQGNVNLASPGASTDGITMATSDRVLVRAQTDATQNGIYVWNGAATPMTRSLDASTFAELEGAAVTVQEGSDAGVTYRQTAVNGTIGSNNISWTTFGTAAPSASESVAGVVELATQGEVNTGTDTVRAVTPATLAGATFLPKKYSTTFGDASNNTYTLTHNLGTRDVQVTVYDAASPYEEVAVDVEHATTNTVEVSMAAAPGVNALRAVVIG
ncbi:MAG TPA: hypothetical protein VGE09_06590 [Pseudoxanthomonas sp.]